MKLEEINELKALLADATPGPWVCCDGPSGYQHRVYGPGNDPVGDVVITRDAALIRAMHAALPRLLALAERVEAAERNERRYLWLRENCKREWESDMPHDKGAPSLDIDFSAPGHDLDAAIDAAMGVRLLVVEGGENG